MSHPLCIQMLKVQKYLSFLFVRKKKQKLPLELCSPPMRHQNAKVPKLTSLPPFSRRDAQTGWHFVRIIDTNGSRLSPLRRLPRAGLVVWGMELRILIDCSAFNSKVPMYRRRLSAFGTLACPPSAESSLRPHSATWSRPGMD